MPYEHNCSFITDWRAHYDHLMKVLFILIPSLAFEFSNFLNTSIEAIHGSRDIKLLFGTYISCDLQVNESHIIKEYITGTWIFLSNTLLYTCNTKAILNLLNANRGGWIFRSRAFFFTLNDYINSIACYLLTYPLRVPEDA